METKTGKVLFEDNADERLAPASVTKVMTILLVYDALGDGRIRWDDVAAVSPHAASMGGSQIFLEAGERQTVRDLLKSVVIASANDAAVALAEFISGSEESFVDLMNRRARDLGMKNTQFKNACGLDADGHFSSARDIAVMSRELSLKYPNVHEYAKIWMDTITHKTARGESEFGLTNTNKLIKQYDGATGLKTGSTAKALFCLSATAERGGMSAVAVIMAAPTPADRFAETAKMFDYAFANYKTVSGDPAGTIVGSARVIGGRQERVEVALKETFSVVAPKISETGLQKQEIIADVAAPALSGASAGEIVYSYDGEGVGRAQLVTVTDVEKATFIDHLRRIPKMLESGE
jgi:D-alanyl-D-alanine carboxypeptidase (penicillin-binding protein 5/6)